MADLIRALAVALTVAFAASAAAGPVLTVVTPDAGGDVLTRNLTKEDLAAFPALRLVTANEYTDGAVAFSGPLMRDVIGPEGMARGSWAVMTAANDYTVRAPINDFADYDVILATSMNGKRLSRRDKGPIWVIYPIDRHRALRNSAIQARMVWQLIRLEVK